MEITFRYHHRFAEVRDRQKAFSLRRKLGFLITDQACGTSEGNVFTGVCHSVKGGGLTPTPSSPGQVGRGPIPPGHPLFPDEVGMAPTPPNPSPCSHPGQIGIGHTLPEPPRRTRREGEVKKEVPWLGLVQKSQKGNAMNRAEGRVRFAS